MRNRDLQEQLAELPDDATIGIVVEAELTNGTQLVNIEVEPTTTALGTVIGLRPLSEEALS